MQAQAAHGRGEVLARQPETAVDRPEGDAERSGDLGLRHAVDVGEHEHRAAVEVDGLEGLEDEGAVALGVELRARVGAVVGRVEAVVEDGALRPRGLPVVGRDAVGEAEEPGARGAREVVRSALAEDRDEDVAGAGASVAGAGAGVGSTGRRSAGCSKASEAVTAIISTRSSQAPARAVTSRLPTSRPSASSAETRPTSPARPRVTAARSTARASSSKGSCPRRLATARRSAASSGQRPAAGSTAYARRAVGRVGGCCAPAGAAPTTAASARGPTPTGRFR